MVTFEMIRQSAGGQETAYARAYHDRMPANVRHDLLPPLSGRQTKPEIVL
jgi:hypothetical protein